MLYVPDITALYILALDSARAERDTALRDLATAKDEVARLDANCGGWTGKKCPACKGTGESNEEGRRSCVGCAGTGELWQTWKEQAAEAKEQVKTLRGLCEKNLGAMMEQARRCDRWGKSHCELDIAIKETDAALSVSPTKEAPAGAPQVGHAHDPMLEHQYGRIDPASREADVQKEPEIIYNVSPLKIEPIGDDKPDTREAVILAATRLSNEVLGSLPLMEELARQQFGNTNYSLLIQRAEEVRKAVAAHVAKEKRG